MLLGIAGAWLALGIVSVVLMRRRGHDAFAWSVLFLFLGPLAIPLAISSDRHAPPQPAAPSHDGALDVLVAHDGSREADAALASALTMFGGGITSVALAAVVDAEAAGTVRGRATVDEARRRLERVAEGVATGAPVEVVVLHGEPAHALERYAADHGYEVIVVGSGTHRSHIAAAAVGRRLSHGAPVPVLVGPAVA